ncbi:SMC-Scp complex subunit ScpB [Puniceicoccus vermicola]|uniref:SMC-Scp complex subunit ScpB n=1 Tax=Puniceicoccus vermicola TaxID=388746 RepID=A0A7X1E3U2_9BACT|nr:SMC-Scp complex subunit ScpB [Puniceicoccus vermicola]MBC2601895.1 SMC-Scp complex subunit ScpB [Puniceicoccus vermicola]
MSADLKKTIEALLFSTSEALPVRELHRVLAEAHEQSLADAENDQGNSEDDDFGGEATIPPPPGTSRLREIIRELRDEWRAADSVYDVAETADGFRMVVRPVYADAVRLLRKEPRPARLSSAAMETLSIVAYRQPVTRSDIERIRGVSADSALSRLTEHDLVEAKGRAELPGRPTVYGTTEKFLDFCGIRSVEDLPSSDVLSPARLDAWLSEDDEEKSPDNADMGLPESEAEAPASEGESAEEIRVEDETEEVK